MSFQPDDITMLHEAIKTRHRISRATANALQSINETNIDSTERIFYEHGGVSAWLAYVLTRDATMHTGHRPGSDKPRKKALIARLDTLSTETRRALAMQVATATKHEATRIERLMQNACEAAKRPRRRRQHTTPSSTPVEEGQAADSDADVLETPPPYPVVAPPMPNGANLMLEV